MKKLLVTGDFEARDKNNAGMKHRPVETGWPLNRKRPGANNSYRTADIFPKGILFSPHPAMPVTIDKKRHG